MTEHELALASELREPFSPLIRPVLEVLRVCKLVSLLRRKPRESAAQPDPLAQVTRDLCGVGASEVEKAYYTSRC